MEIANQINYEPSTGEFRWLVSNNQKIKIGDIAGFIRKDGYRILKLEGRQYLAHRVAFFLMTGVWPTKIDHKNRNRSDNRWGNLRLATWSENNANRPPRGYLGLKGVFKSYNKFEARAYKDGQKYTIGVYDGPLEAANAYDEVAIKLHGEFAYTNSMTPREVKNATDEDTAGD